MNLSSHNVFVWYGESTNDMEVRIGAKNFSSVEINVVLEVL